jgi:hypothetical protein
MLVLVSVLVLVGIMGRHKLCDKSESNTTLVYPVSLPKGRTDHLF